MKIAFIKINPDVLTSTDPLTVVQFDSSLHAQLKAVNDDGFELRPRNVTVRGEGLYVAVSYDESDIVSSEYNVDAVSKMTILYASSTPDYELLSYLDMQNLMSSSAFSWAYSIGNKDVMKDYIAEDRLVNFVKYVYPEYREEALAKITTENVLCDWGVELGDRDSIRDKIVSSNCAFAWALNIPEERAAMKPRITEPVWIEAWNIEFPDDKII